MGQRGACARKRPYDVRGHFSLTCCDRFSYAYTRGFYVPIVDFGGGRERPPFFVARIGHGGVAQFTFAQRHLGGRSRPNYPWREGQK